ncbi:hypothetical protein Pelo_544 [Pelomyxa schiedti]|nr:hypothetical protein Pelo_544 [Pelomyxa schiedti]
MGQGRIVRWTLLMHVVFFLILGASEFLAPRYACVKGLADPLVKVGMTPEEMCDGIDRNPVSVLIFFGLRKYHVLWFLFNIISWWHVNVLPQTMLASVFFLQALNYFMDDTWAAIHITWTAGPYILIPQALIVFWDLYVFSRVLLSNNKVKPSQHEF